MKLKLILILIVLLSGCNNKKSVIELNTEVVIDVTDKDRYLNNLFEIHPDRQVKIYRSPSPRDPTDKYLYTICAYRNKGGQLISCMIEATDNYNKSAYRWVNDSTLNFKLYNSTNYLSTHCIYSVNGFTNSIQIDSINNVPVY